jgi:hypothetical protein
MKKFSKLDEGLQIFLLIVFIIILFFGIVFTFEYVTTETKLVGAVILEHNVTADRRGNRTYTTIIKTDDGFIEEKEGLNYYARPIGSRVNVNVRRLKK